MKVAADWTRRLVEAGVIAGEDEEIYRFGLEQGVWMALNLATALVLGAVCGMLWQVVCFMGAYMPLRVYAGGYHARTPWRCYGGGIVLLLAALALIEGVAWTLGLGVVVMGLAGALVWALAPVADSNKPLSGRERVVYAKRARGVALAEVAAALVAWAVGWRVLFEGVCTMFVVMAVMLVLGWLRNGLLRQEGLE